MNRNLQVERLYSLGDYKNIKFTNGVNDIPQELALNEKVTELLFFQQALSCEIAYRRYYDLIEKISEEMTIVKNGRRVVDGEQALAFLQEQKETTMKELYSELNATYGDKPETVAQENNTEKETK